ncbi:MAG: NAD(P)/FAD-dependent oxidoreductase [Polyangiaceae bacterium]|nr:NAD(P)/FAD-dependent oxidoreductase [Polyangiaceae bacterium]
MPGLALGSPRVVIVGGGPAGTTTALALAHEAPEWADRVVVLEKATYPRDKPCAGAVGGRADRLLAELGVTVHVPSVTIDGFSVRTRAADRTVAPGAVGRVVRRIEFDHALARAVIARGITVRDGVCVDEVHEEGPVVRIGTQHGAVTADVAVGCDGVGSLLRRAMGASPGPLRAQVIEVDTPPLPSDRPRHLIHFDASDPALAGYVWDFPTEVGGEALVCRGVYRVRIDGDGDAEPLAALLARRLEALGVASTCGRNKRYAERGFDDVTRYASARCMLVGEAAGIDALTGEGIAQAIEYGVLAGRFLARKLRASPAGPIDVSDWHDAVRRSRLARDLRLRALVFRAYHGAWRDEIERFFADVPEALAVGAGHFAARPADWLEVGHVAALAAARAASAIVARSLRG